MPDAPRPILTDQELEDQLQELGRHVNLPRTSQLAQRVRAALLAEEAGATPRSRVRSGWWSRYGRRVLIGVAACIALIALVIALSPAARATIADALGIPAVRITRVQPSQPPPKAVGGNLNLGHRTSLAAAQQQAPFRIALPHYQTITRPDEVYVGGSLPGQVSLVYRARTGLPRAAGTGVGLLITEFRAGLDVMVLKKLVYIGTTVEAVHLPGANGVWLSGAPHFFGYATDGGTVIIEPLRFAGNTLLWDHGAVTYRLEGRVSKDLALRIAESMH
jgi:hypothetical protein